MTDLSVAPLLTGRQVAPVNSHADHILLPPSACVEGAPFSEERVVPEDHGLLQAGQGEHILANPSFTHEVMPRQRDWERDAD